MAETPVSPRVQRPTWYGTSLLFFICPISLSHQSSGHKSATSSTQRPYRTSIPARESWAGRTVISRNRVRHSVDRPRAFLHVLSSCTQIRQYRIPDGPEFMKFSVRIPILNLHKHSAQVRDASSELRIMRNSDTDRTETDL